MSQKFWGSPKVWESSHVLYASVTNFHARIFSRTILDSHFLNLTTTLAPCPRKQFMFAVCCFIIGKKSFCARCSWSNQQSWRRRHNKQICCRTLVSTLWRGWLWSWRQASLRITNKVICLKAEEVVLRTAPRSCRSMAKSRGQRWALLWGIILAVFLWIFNKKFNFLWLPQNFWDNLVVQFYSPKTLLKQSNRIHCAFPKKFEIKEIDQKHGH